MSDKINKVGSIDLETIKAKMVELKNSGLLPRGFAKKIADKLGVTTQKVYQITNGVYYNEDIVNEVLEIAADNKIKKQIEKANDILS